MKPDTCKTEGCSFFAMEDDGYCADCWFGTSLKCPCKLADEPCQKNCTCVNQVMSHGCYCCTKYGSKDQQKAAANNIVSSMKLSVLMNKLAESGCDLRSENIPTGGDDYDVGWKVIEHSMSEPFHVEIGRGSTPQEALESAFLESK